MSGSTPTARDSTSGTRQAISHVSPQGRCKKCEIQVETLDKDSPCAILLSALYSPGFRNSMDGAGSERRRLLCLRAVGVLLGHRPPMATGIVHRPLLLLLSSP